MFNVRSGTVSKRQVMDKFFSHLSLRGCIRTYSLCLLPLFAFLLVAALPAKVHANLSLAGKLNVNNATKKELLLLPEIGEVRSEAIFSFRQKQGKFRSVDDLLNVKGIGLKTVQTILPYVKLAGESDLHIIDISTGSPIKYDSGETVNANTKLLGNEEFFFSLLHAIKEAGKSIDASMFLFKTSNYPSNRANMILDALGEAAERGIEVSLLLEKGRTGEDDVSLENNKSAEKLKSRGVKVSFDKGDVTTHTKVIVVDKMIVFLGSHNFTHSALKYNNELSVRIDSSNFAKDVLKYMNGLL